MLLGCVFGNLKISVAKSVWNIWDKRRQARGVAVHSQIVQSESFWPRIKRSCAMLPCVVIGSV